MTTKTVTGRRGRVLMVGITICLVSHAAEKGKLPPETAGLVGRAQGAQPEIAAQILTRIAARAKGTDPKVRLELLRQAQQVARQSHYPEKRAARKGIPVDSRDGYVMLSMRDGFAGLDLQCDSVEQAADIDSEQAREMFADITLTNTPATCSEALAPDRSRYIRTFSKLYPKFTQDDIERGKQRQFARMALGKNLDLAAAVEAVSWLRATKMSAADRNEFAVLIAGRLSEVVVSGREAPLLDALAEQIKQSGDSNWIESERILLPSIRRVAIDTFGAKLCMDVWRTEIESKESVIQKVLGQSSLPDSITRLNDRFAAGGVPPIEPKEIKNSRPDASLKEAPHWQSTHGRLIMNLMKRYNAAREKRVTLVEQKVALEELEKGLNDWDEKDEVEPTDFLSQKFYVLFKLFREASSGDGQEKWAADELSRLLTDARIQEKDPAVWLHLARRAIVESDGPDKAKGQLIRQIFQRAPNATLGLLAGTPIDLLKSAI